MSKEAGPGCKRCLGGRIFKKLLVLVAIIGLFYGALYRVQTQTWPWQDWNAFFTFSTASTKSAFEKGKSFAKNTLAPKTKELLARAHDLLESWDTERAEPASEPAGEGAEPTEGEESNGEALELAGAGEISEGEGDSEVEVRVAKRSPEDSEVIVAEGAVKTDPVAATAEVRATPDTWREGRVKFKDGLKNYQQSSPEMDGSQDALKAAKADFEASRDLLEKAKEEDPDNHLIERDLQEVQIFLVDCQRRLTIETETY